MGAERARPSHLYQYPSIGPFVDGPVAGSLVRVTDARFGSSGTVAPMALGSLGWASLLFLRRPPQVAELVFLPRLGPPSEAAPGITP